MEPGLSHVSYAKPKWKYDVPSARMDPPQYMHIAQKFCQLLLEWNWNYALIIAQKILEK